MSHNISQTRICVQQILPHDKDEFNFIHNSEHSPELEKRLKASFFTKKLWPKESKIRIGFLGNGNNVPRTNLSGEKNVDPLQNKVENMSVKEAVKKIVNERIKPLVDLDINFVENIYQANVRVAFDPDGGAWSLVGTDHLHEKDHTKSTINLGWFDVGTTIHEFCHMLGMIHEHQNPRGQNIQWDVPKVLNWAKETQGWSEETTKENIINKYDKSFINGSDFDPLSIMLYFFPSDLTTNGIGTKQNFQMSGLDVQWINHMYQKNKNGDEDIAEIFKSFYPNETLETNIIKSKNLSYKQGEDNADSNINWKILKFGVGIILLTLVLSTLISGLLRKKQSNRRYR